MERYEQYKDSGVEWIGEIPVGWEVKKLKYFVSKVGSGVTPRGGASVYQLSGIPLLRSQNIHFDGLKMDDVAYIDEDTHNAMANSQVHVGDVLLNITGASIGRCFYFGGGFKEANVNQHVCIIRPDNQTETLLLYYILRSNVGQEQINFEQTGSGREGLNFEALNKFIIPSIPRSEQADIIDYLYLKIKEIDALISQKERLLALYEEEKTAIINQAVTKGIDPDTPLKDSGVEWLGEIPVGWNIVKLKYLTAIISKGTTPSTINREIIPYGSVRFIKAENIQGNAVSNFPENYIDDDTNFLLRRSQLEAFDILFVIAGATIGKVAILEKEYLPANTNQAISFIRLNNKNSVGFIWYWLQSDTINKILWLDAVQSAQPNLSMENLGNFYIPYPSLDDQITIIQYIKAEVARIDDKISKTKHIIELQKEYRTALISEVVTGKVKVTNLESNEVAQ